jgi:hypothetical protein
LQTKTSRLSGFKRYAMMGSWIETPSFDSHDDGQDGDPSPLHVGLIEDVSFDVGLVLKYLRITCPRSSVNPRVQRVVAEHWRANAPTVT